MFKQVLTLLKGANHRASEEFTDAHALMILEQQLRDAAASVTAAKKSVALAMAQAGQERDQQTRLLDRIADLEIRAMEAMEKKKPALAQEAAAAIAALEQERDASEETLKQFDREITRLTAEVQNSESRLRQLSRGQKIAAATDRAQKLRRQGPALGSSTLADAEITLQRLQHRQNQVDRTALAFDKLNPQHGFETLSERLADAGCGAPVKTSADSVLERLAKRKAK